MRLIFDRIITEFNKIYFGTKRVGDAAKLGGKYERNLSVLDSSKLGGKTESSLNVNHSVFSDNAEKIRSVDINGEPTVNINGEPVYKTENTLSVYNTEMVRGLEPFNLEVDISRRLKAGELPDSPTFTVASLMSDVNLRRVKDSALLAGKTEDTLDVRTAVNADNAYLLDNTSQSELVVKEANQALKLKRSNGDLVGETELIVYASNHIKYGTVDYNLIELRDYILSSEQAKEVLVYNAFTANGLKMANGNTKSWDELKDELKTDSNSEIYKATRFVVSSSEIYTGVEYKTWVINSVDFSNKVAALNANTANRAVRFGDADDNKTITEFRAEILTTKVNNAKEADTLNGNSAENIISTTRSRILTNASSNLTTNEADGFFSNNDVKLNVKAIKVDAAVNADTLSTFSYTDIKDQVKSEGGVYSSKYIYTDPNGSGLKSYIDITNDINNSKISILDGVSTDYDTLLKIETIIKDNKTDLDNKIITEQVNRTTADNNLTDRIDTLTSDFNNEVSTRVAVDNQLTSELELKLNHIHQLKFDVILTSDATAVIGTRYYVDVTNNPITLILPDSSVSNFDRILIHCLAGDFSVNNLTIESNNTFMKSSSPLIVNTNDETFELVFINNDWRIL